MKDNVSTQSAASQGVAGLGRHGTANAQGGTATQVPQPTANRKEIEVKKLTDKDYEALERALCTLVDYEEVIKDRLASFGTGERAHSDVCHALRQIVDGGEK